MVHSPILGAHSAAMRTEHFGFGQVRTRAYPAAYPINQDSVHFSGSSERKPHQKFRLTSIFASVALALGCVSASSVGNRSIPEKAGQKSLVVASDGNEKEGTDKFVSHHEEDKSGFTLSKRDKASEPLKNEMVLAAKALSSKSNETVKGKASWYGPGLWGNPTASGQPLRYKLTAAHRYWPFGACVRVTNRANGKTTKVRINDRGPFVSGRIIDLNERAARKISMIGSGVANVTLKRIPKSNCKGSAYQN